ncbi:hypothetical protein FRC09_011222 [Ceratobasidium sp. 395]|nr:hypothetical protein FRC09_011222 [Ceratobasidium sp. 395]
MVLGIARANATQLGFDPDSTLTVSTKPTSLRYDIIVRSSNKTQSVHRAVETFSEVGAESFIGRGTRVWKVRKLDDTGKPLDPIYALKDTWTRHDCPVECDVITKIEGSSPECSRYFSILFGAGLVPVHTGHFSQPDNIKRTIRRGKDLVLIEHVLQPAEAERREILKGQNRATATSRTAQQPKKSSGSLHCTPTTPQVGNWDYWDINESPHRRCQAVFKGIGEPIHCLRSYQDVITAIQGASKGLQAIHTAGYVHCDVSSGNILLVPDEGGGGRRGVIVDLEYTKEVSDQSDSHGIKIGAYESTAIEVALSKYVHRLPQTIDLSKPIVPRAPPPPFRQNQLHDLESIWWIYMWTAFQIVGSAERLTARYLAKYDEIFRSHLARACFWALGGEFACSTTDFSNPSVVRAMGYWRQQLLQSYAESYGAGGFFDVTPDSLHEARAAQEAALDLISTATRDYSSNLKLLSELVPIPTIQNMQPDDAQCVNDSKGMEKSSVPLLQFDPAFSPRLHSGSGSDTVLTFTSAGRTLMMATIATPHYEDDNKGARSLPQVHGGGKESGLQPKLNHECEDEG